MRAYDTLIKLHKARLDEKRRKLSDIQRVIDQMWRDIRRLEAELETEMKISAADPKIGVMYPQYAMGNKAKREGIAASIRELEKQAEIARNEVTEAYQEVRKFELAKEAKLKKIGAEQDRKDRLVLDEMGLTQHRRKMVDGY